MSSAMSAAVRTKESETISAKTHVPRPATFADTAIITPVRQAMKPKSSSQKRRISGRPLSPAVSKVL